MRVKICGFTSETDVKNAAKFGADMIGVIMVSGSKRYLDAAMAKHVLSAAPRGVSRVIVVMPGSIEDLKTLEDKLRPDYIQIHLTYPPADLVRARSQLKASLIVVAPVPPNVVDRKSVIANAVRIAEVGDILLIDTKGPTGGGTGLSHDWTISREIRESVDKPVFLAGGLNPSNVVAALHAVRPEGVDVSSGVEAASGAKDPELMREFIRAARRA